MGMLEGIARLEEAMHRLEEEIATESEKMKSLYTRAALSMPEDKSYYLNGVQTGPVVKAFLLTSQGIGVQGEGSMSIPDFIDSALRFANFPRRKIEVLRALAGHLEKIYTMIGHQYAD